MIMIRCLCLLLLSQIFISCASNPKKDIFIKMRPPSSEAPYFHKDRGFGFHLGVEQRRVMINPTLNLVNNFNFDNNSIYDASANVLPAGIDFSALYTHAAFGIPVEYELSTDFAHIKFQLLDLRQDKMGFYVTGNFGAYASSVWTDSGACQYICFSTGPEKNISMEQSIQASAAGRERKWGLSIGYYTQPDRAIFVAHNLYENLVSLSASRPTTEPLEINANESVYGFSNGLGYLMSFNEKHFLTFTLDSYELNWRKEKISRGSLGIHFSVGF
jgi:hypothetical protein